MVSRQVVKAVRIVRMLEARADENFASIAKDIDGAIAVVDVEVENRHALDIGTTQCRVGADRDAVVEAEPHRGAFLCMMSRRTNGAECLSILALKDDIDSLENRADRASRRDQRTRAHVIVRTDRDDVVRR